MSDRNPPTKEQATAIYQALLREENELREFLAQVDEKEKRLRALGNGWHCTGELECARRDVRDAEFPVWHHDGYWTEFLIDVNEKWIVIRRRHDNDGSVRQYNRATGMEKGKRASYHSPIDAKRAEKLWKERAGLRTNDAAAEDTRGASAETK